MTSLVLLLVPTAAEADALLETDGLVAGVPRAATVRRGDASRKAARATDPHVAAALCGFGPAVAGLFAAEAIERAHPVRVVLAGLAGTYREAAAPVGGIVVASDVRAEVGRGRGAAFRSAASIGFPQAPASMASDDVFPTFVPGGVRRMHPDVAVGGVLTVACASGSAAEARERADREPLVLAEDMESFAVAVACRRRDVPLTVVRALANVAGDADRAHWHVPEAMEALRDVLRTAVGADGG